MNLYGKLRNYKYLSQTFINHLIGGGVIFTEMIKVHIISYLERKYEYKMFRIESITLHFLILDFFIVQTESRDNDIA